MPSAKFVKKCQIGTSFRVEKAKGMFDLAEMDAVRTEFDVDIPIEGREWNIGLIVGSSGSGKTTIAKELFPECYFFTEFAWEAKSMIEDFPATMPHEEVFKACASVGLNSAPDWLKPYSVLSNGQRMRADMARLLCEHRDQTVIYDEFSSVVDRQVACVSSAAIAKYVRRGGARFIAVSCHRDVEAWLDPDWVYDTDASEFRWRSLQGRPKIRLDIRKAGRAEWDLFKRHHYLSSGLWGSKETFVAEINKVPVAFAALMPSYGFKCWERVHRLVVRPDYQGLGIGTAMANYLGEMVRGRGKDLSLTTSLALFARTMAKNRMWKLASAGYQERSSTMRLHGAKKKNRRDVIKASSQNRLTCRFVYVGGGNSGT